MNKPQRIMQMVMAILIVVAAIICHSFGVPDGLILLVAGNDPEGVKDIQIWVEETRWFIDPNTGQETQQGPGSLSAPEQSNPDNASGGQTVCTSRLASLNLDLQ